MATYGKFEGRANRRNQPRRIIEGNVDRGRNGPSQYGLQRSFADVLKNGVSILVRKAVHTIEVDEEGHDWLYDSILLKFKAEFSVQCVKSVLKEKGLGHVLVRNGGGRVVVMSFLSINDMMSNLASIKAWFQDWCEFVKVSEERSDEEEEEEEEEGKERGNKDPIVTEERIMHDWNDEGCVNILKNCRKAIPEKIGKVIIIDVVLNPEGDGMFDDTRLVFDLLMIAHSSGGKERTELEWKKVLEEGGFPRYNVIKIAAFPSIIEAFLE
ncbi:hypothetical protein TEA_018434 [Camellia sinensis var. sinensis]|uniref:O-methyltransferase C-terminal domain-containing protein n=1 Tax=Camellia sinensis var. sinensis TaxID=542762 RepID=A0A4S4DES8_CAMSN|nr:hypothetical protein TEA_018434 [Camellia sinensis var. sinensis]